MVTINISNKAVYLIIGILVVVLVAGLGIAAWTAPAAWHSSADVRVSIGGVAYSLQDAINAGLIGGGAGNLVCEGRKRASGKTCDQTCASYGQECVSATEGGNPHGSARACTITSDTAGCFCCKIV